MKAHFRFPFASCVCVALSTLLFVAITPQVQAQATRKGQIMVEPYYGFPNLWTGLLKVAAVAYSDVNEDDIEASGLGPMGIRAQYMVTDQLSVGLDFFYASSRLKYLDNTTDGLGNPVTYSYEINMPRPRFLIRGEYHIPASDAIDPYAAGGLGVDATSLTFKTNDPFFIEDEFKVRGSLPVSYRLAFGSRFYLARNVGLGIELGLGGPLLTGGLALKF